MELHSTSYNVTEQKGYHFVAVVLYLLGMDSEEGGAQRLLCIFERQ